MDTLTKASDLPETVMRHQTLNLMQMKLEGEGEGIWVAKILDGSFAKVMEGWDSEAGVHFTNEELESLIMR